MLKKKTSAATTKNAFHFPHDVVIKSGPIPSSSRYQDQNSTDPLEFESESLFIPPGSILILCF